MLPYLSKMFWNNSYLCGSTQYILRNPSPAFGHHHQHGFVEHAVLLHVQHHGNGLAFPALNL